MALGRVFISHCDSIPEDEIYGIEQLASGGETGSWRTVDGNGNTISLINNTEKRFPWRCYKEMTVDNIPGIYVPKIYVKNEVEIENGTGYNLIKRYISNKKFEGFHCHPAFMVNGVEKNGILFSSSWSNAVTPTGWHCFNFYEYSLLALLVLIKYANTNIQVNANSTDFLYFSQKMTGIDGLGSNGTTLRILNNQGNGTMIDTGVLLPSVGQKVITIQTLDDGTKEANHDIFIVDFNSVTGENFDLNDIFFPNNLSNKSAEAISEAQCLIANNSHTPRQVGGIFGFYLEGGGGTLRGYRLAKYI